MPIIAQVGRRSWAVRGLFLMMYLVLALLGVTMVYPFLITLTASVSTAMDYPRFAAVPRALWSHEERFVRGLVAYYPETMRGALDQLALQFQGVPAPWTSWQGVGRDPAAVEAFARPYLQLARDPVRWQQAQRMAEDYDAFARQYPLSDSLCSFNPQDIAGFIRQRYTRAGDSEAAALRRLEQSWGVPFDSFYAITSTRELQTPWDQASYVPPQDPRAQDFARLTQAYRDRQFLPSGLRTAWRAGHGAAVPISETRPYPLKVAWLRFLGSPTQRSALRLPAGSTITLAEYNATFGTQYASLRATPFPVPASAPALLRASWTTFVQRQFPVRLMEIRLTPQTNAAYRAFVQQRFKGNLTRANGYLGTNARTWDQVPLTAMLPNGSDALRGLWLDFVGQRPLTEKTLHCAEIAYQQYLLKKYGSLAAANAAYGWQLSDITQAEMPYDMAYLVTFVHNEPALSFDALTRNYRYVADYLVLRGRAVGNTLVLILLTLLAALTINPLAAYALSRFRMRQMPAIILFMLATMAFPAAVSMIPNYLLMRDTHLLNTYAALILPSVANGMSIFLLKGFFDSLPPELYEAASLDGAPEWQMFLRITLPLSKPILAVIALNSFLAAYNGWEWALVVCQNPKMWTLAVWIYQFNTQYASDMPWAVMAAFVVASLPVFLVFVLCQNIILRGIVLPQMK